MGQDCDIGEWTNHGRLAILGPAPMTGVRRRSFDRSTETTMYPLVIKHDNGNPL